MDCNDDIPGDLTSTITVQLGETFESTLDHTGCGDNDVDYLQLELEYGKRYSLRSFLGSTEPRNSADLPIYGVGTSGFSDLTKTFRAIYGGTHYFRISTPYRANYQFTLSEIDSEDQVRIDEFPLGYAAFDKLSESVRTVPFRFTTTPGEEYILNVFGVDGGGIGTLPDPWIGVGDRKSNAWFDQDGGTGRNGHLRFTAQDTVSYATVGGEGNGTFRLNIRQADTVPVGPATTRRIGPTARVIGNIDTANDIDWFRVSMEAGQWYQIESVEGDEPARRFSILLRDPSREFKDVMLPSSEFDGSQREGVLYYQAETTGDHFVIARLGSIGRTGNYALTARPVAPPIQDAIQDPDENNGGIRRFVVGADEPLSLSEFLVDDRAVGGPALSEYEVYASKGLFRDEAPQNLDMIHSIPAAEIGLWTQRFDTELETTDLLIRAKIGNAWTRWDRTPILHRTTNPALISGSHWELTEETPDITWNFSDTIPDYFEGTYTDIQENNNVRVAASNIAYNNANGGLLRRLANDGNRNANIRVFVADGVDGYVDAYAPGPDSGGDIVLNSEFYAAGEIRPGSIEYLEIVRGFATALGLSKLEDGNLRHSVMADLSSIPDLLPITFMLHDELAIEEIYGVDISPRYYQWTLDGFAQRPKPATGRDYVSIDMREGGEVKTKLNEGDGPVIVGYTGPGEEKTGSISNFYHAGSLFGNSLDNELHMYLNGWIDGREGDDQLYGYAEANWYGYKYGSGDDVITENRYSQELSNPRDTLRLSGYDDFEITLDRLQFTRQDWTTVGNSVDLGPISLRIDVLNEQGNSDGSVTIDRQGRAINRVESLEIFMDSSRTQRINLPSLYSQLAPGESMQFQLSSGSDALGSFVSPI